MTNCMSIDWKFFRVTGLSRMIGSFDFDVLSPPHKVICTGVRTNQKYYVLSSAHRISSIRLNLISWPFITHGVLRLACACDLMTAGAKLPWQVASAVCVRGLQVAVASCDRCMCGIMAGCYRNLRSPYVRGPYVAFCFKCLS